MNKTLPLPVAAILVCALAMLPVSAQNADPKMSFFIVSSGPGSGADLGGLAGADGRCQMLARAVGAGNRTWRAYLSATASDGQPAVNARDRIGSGPWFNAKGVQIASDVDDLHSDKQQLDQGDAAERVRKDGQRPGRQSQPARYPDRFAIGRHGPSGQRRHHLRKLDESRRRQRPGRAPRPHRWGDESHLVEFGAWLSGLQPGEPAGYRRRWAVLLLRHRLKLPARRVNRSCLRAVPPLGAHRHTSRRLDRHYRTDELS